jgi:DNA-directed RNA polymerase specialized sigma24 family protein
VPAAGEIVDLRALASKAARDGLRRIGARLDDARFEDLVSDLTIAGLRAQARFDPTVGQAQSTWCYRTMRRRIPDHFRKLLGDARNLDPPYHPRSAVLLEPKRLHDLLAENGHESAESHADAAERIAVRHDLSAEAADTLKRVVLPLAGGWRVPEVAHALKVRPSDVEEKLVRLRAELDGGGPRISLAPPESPRALARDKSEQNGVSR